MDLERLGAPEQARDFLAWYAEFSGDHAPPALVHHYVAYRAFVRAKVACLRGAQGADVGTELDAYLRVTLEHLRAGAVRLVLVGGPPGSGKTTLATNLADRLGAVDISSDRVRKELAGLDPTVSAADDFGRGIYTAEHSERTYRELLHRAGVLLARGESVVLDATWSRRDQRLAAHAAAESHRADLVQLRCDTSAAAALQRVAARAGSVGTVSDADVTVAARMRESADAWPESHAVDTSTTVVRSVDRAAELVVPSGAARGVSPRRRTFVLPD
jgi:predicted kinase